MTNDILHQTAAALQQEWQITLTSDISEEALLQLLANRIVMILEQGAETFFQLMYRLDISEKKLNAVLGDDNVPQKIARLVYDRQLQKIQSRLNNKMTAPEEDSELKW
jgi:aspartate/glutamate racemase